MVIRYTYFKAQPRGYGIYDELTRHIVGYTDSMTEVVQALLWLNRHGMPPTTEPNAMQAAA